MPQEDVDLTDDERDPDRQARRRTRRDERIGEREQREAGPVEEIQPQRRRMPAHEARAGDEGAERAAAVLDDDPDARVVEDQVREDQQSDEEQVADAAGRVNAVRSAVMSRVTHGIEVVEEPADGPRRRAAQ